MTDVDLRHHGDSDLAPGCVDLAVNVRAGAPPTWLRERLRGAVDHLAAYPDVGPARRAVAARHHRPPDEVLVTAGGAEAFVLLARALRPRHAVVVHPQFTEPESALRTAGLPVERVILPWPFTLEAARAGGVHVPEEADLVVVGNPTNPTSVLHAGADLASLARPGRVLVVDEAFMDAVPDERESLANRRDIPGLLVVRSLTKTWGLAGLRIGYLLGAQELVHRVGRAQPLWAVSTPAVLATTACCEQRALVEAQAWARHVTRDRDALVDALSAHAPGVEVVPGCQGPFVLLRLPTGASPRFAGPGVRSRLRARGWAVRRGDTFPGLGPEWLRVAVRDPVTSLEFARTLGEILR